MDAARVARRLGADDTVIVYRRTRDQMPAHEEEAVDAEEEGIRINWLRTISSMGEHDLTVEVQELDERGRPHGTGQFETLAADTVILALGQESDTGFLHAVPGVAFDGDTVQVDPATLMTGAPGVFAGGDAVPSERTVTVGRGTRQEGRPQHRRLAARRRRSRRRRSTRWPPSTASTSGTSATTTAASRPSSTRQTRVRAFDEVAAGLTAQEVAFEAGALPVLRQLLRVRRLPRRLSRGRGHQARQGPPLPRSTTTACTGCGTCYRQCPVHAIEMVPEPSSQEEG